MTHRKEEYVLGYDVGGTSARAALFSRTRGEGALTHLRTLKRELRRDTSPQAILALMYTLGDELLAAHNLDLSHVTALGCGIAAQMDPAHAIALNAPNLGWRDVPIQHMARDMFSRDVSFFNDLNVLLWGEFVAGAALGKRDVLAVAIGSGVGGAIIAGGELIVGARGQAAELGHVKVEMSGGKACGCGEFGCIEAYAGGVHLEHAVRQLVLAHPGAPWVDDVCRQEDGALHIDLARADACAAPEVVALFDQAVDLLAGVIANACTLLNPQVVVLGGGVFTHCAIFRSKLLARIPPRVLEVSRVGLELVPCALGEHAALLGAASLGLQVAHRNWNAP